ncbi:MAG: hypothetical protein WED15_03070 [Akkermansiaceae bacterium]
MKSKFTLGIILLSSSVVSAQSLYHSGSDEEEAFPLKWAVGTNLLYDDNVSPGFGPKEGSLAINPTVGLSVVSTSPQTTWDVHGRLGLIYYFDAPPGVDSTNSQSRAGANFNHRFSERFRISSSNFASYELEPDYSYGYASTRLGGESLNWSTDNTLAYRWSERYGTVHGLRLNGQDSDASDNDIFTWTFHNQLRYQLGPQTVLSGNYRYAVTSGGGRTSDSTSHYLLAGAEHSFGPNTIGIVRLGSQFRDVDEGKSSTSPYLELAANSKLTQQLSIRSFTRYGIEASGTVLQHPDAGFVEFDERTTLRFGVTAEYTFSPILSFFGGLDYIPTSYEAARSLDNPPVPNLRDLDEDIVNAYIGVSVRFAENLTGTLSYNFTDSSSNIPNRSYNRNRISIGVNATF